MTEYFKPSDIVVLRGIEHDGELEMLISTRVVEDSEQRTFLYVSDGAPMRGGGHRLMARVRDPGVAIQLTPENWRGTEFVSIHYPDRMYSVWAMWKMPERKFQCWYVNIEPPLKRTADGFDMTELAEILGSFQLTA